MRMKTNKRPSVQTDEQTSEQVNERITIEQRKLHGNKNGQKFGWMNGIEPDVKYNETTTQKISQSTPFARTYALTNDAAVNCTHCFCCCW